MFDNLREDAASSYDNEQKKPAPSNSPKAIAGPAPTFNANPPSRRILGMTAQQRFILVFMLMLAVCVIGVMTLFVTGKIGF